MPRLEKIVQRHRTLPLSHLSRMNRRQFLQSSFAASLATALPTHAELGRRPRILLRNGWQSINIGDVGHQLGILELLEAHGIDAEVRLWPSNVENGAKELLQKTFPKLVIHKGGEKINQSFEECDFLLHGSGSGFVAQGDTTRWRKETGKPYGIIGISTAGLGKGAVETLNGASFVYFRDSVSLGVAKAAGCTCPIMEFGPDTAFGIVKLRDDASADAFMKEHGLEAGKFMCCIPRYRWTPHWTVKKGREFDAKKDARNQEKKEHDHAQLRESIIRITRETELKVLICCEDMTQVTLGKEMVYDPLPDDVKAKVVWRDRFWLTDEALSTFTKSAGLFGNEMHSPIMCIANGIPAVVCRWDEQTKKGFMWRDIGLDEWLFDMDNEKQVANIVPTVVAMAKDPASAKEKAAKAQAYVLQRQEAQMGALKSALKKAVPA